MEVICHTECEGLNSVFTDIDKLRCYMEQCHNDNLEVQLFDIDGNELKYTCNKSTGYKPVLEPLEDED